MSSSSKKQKPAEDWGKTPTLTPEQIIEWLDGYRSLMFEVWKNNPKAREEWERVNEVFGK